ncbi:unnamed protein product [Linum tenue]|uniref:Uncharacterized protein n=1 Tax=Linum tenue TaxID=586396 RepID=A0AAV0NFT2_9ROSI|nr:unnamed protein product [Linum tenue]
MKQEIIKQQHAFGSKASAFLYFQNEKQENGVCLNGFLDRFPMSNFMYYLSSFILGDA